MRPRKLDAAFIQNNRNIKQLENILPNLTDTMLNDLLVKSGLNQLDQSVFSEILEDNSEFFLLLRQIKARLGDNKQGLLLILSAVSQFNQQQDLINYFDKNFPISHAPELASLRAQVLQLSDLIHKNPLIDSHDAEQQALARKTLQFVLGQFNLHLAASLQPQQPTHTIESDEAFAKNLAKKWAEEDSLQADFLLAQKLQKEEDEAYFLEKQKAAEAAAFEESIAAERKQQATAEVHREYAAASHAQAAAQQQAPARNNVEPIVPNIAPLAFDAAAPVVANAPARPANAKPLSRTTQHVLDHKDKYADAFNGLSDAELTKLLEENNVNAMTMIETFNSESGSIGLVLQSVNEDFKDDAKTRALIMHHLLNSSKEQFERFFQKNAANQPLQDNKAGLLSIHEMVQHAKRPIMVDYQGDNNVILNHAILKNRSSDAKFEALSRQEKVKVLQQEVNAFANVLNASLNSNLNAATKKFQPADQEAFNKELATANYSETTQAVLQNKDDYQIFKHLTESELVSLLDKNNLPVVTLQSLYTEYGSITSVMDLLDDLAPAVKADILYRLLNSSESEFKRFLANNAGNATIQSSKDSLLQLHRYLSHSAIPAKMGPLYQRDQHGNVHEVGQGLDLRNQVTQLVKRNFKEADVADARYGEANFADKQARLEQQLPAINKQQAQFHNVLTATLNSHYKAAVKALPVAEQKAFNQAHPERSQRPAVIPTPTSAAEQRRIPNSSPAALRGPHTLFPAYGNGRHRHEDNEIENFFAALQRRAPINRHNEAMNLLNTLLQAVSFPPARHVNEDNIFMSLVGLHAFRELSPRPFQIFILDNEQPATYYAVRMIGRNS